MVDQCAQDWFAMEPSLRIENPTDERINIPAIRHHYWRYRIQVRMPPCASLLPRPNLCTNPAESGGSDREASRLHPRGPQSGLPVRSHLRAIMCHPVLLCTTMWWYSVCCTTALSCWSPLARGESTQIKTKKQTNQVCSCFFLSFCISSSSRMPMCCCTDDSMMETRK